MEKLNITPGKWEVTGDLDMLRIEKRRSDGSWALIAEVHTEDHNPPRYEEAEANAKLIANAPQMLKELIKLRSAFEKTNCCNHTKGEYNRLLADSQKIINNSIWSPKK